MGNGNCVSVWKSITAEFIYSRALSVTLEWRAVWVVFFSFYFYFSNLVQSEPNVAASHPSVRQFSFQSNCSIEWLKWFVNNDDEQAKNGHNGMEHVSNKKKSVSFGCKAFAISHDELIQLEDWSIGAYVLFAISPFRKIFMSLQLNKSP